MRQRVMPTRARSSSGPGPVSHSADVEPSAQNDFRSHVARLFLLNEFSAKGAQQLYATAARDGARGVHDLAAAGSSGQAAGNIHRDLMRNLAKDSRMPKPYWAAIPLQDSPDKPVEEVKLPFLLPHEVLDGFARQGNFFNAIPKNMPELAAARAKVATVLSTPPEELTPIGIHGDGVPHQKKGTIECLSWNPCAHPHCERILFGVLEKRYLCKCGCKGRHSLEAALAVFTWSLQCLADGTWPSTRHDSTAWLATDTGRKGNSGALPVKAVLLQVRADWAWLKQVFGFPSWSNKSICWRCRANDTDYDWHTVGLAAAWRSARLSSRQFFGVLRASGVTPSVLFDLPGFATEMITIDVLHASDLGFTQDLLGNIIWEYARYVAHGANLEARMDVVWTKLKKHYETMHTTNRLHALTVEMVRPPGKKPKMRTKGAETRNLVPFGVVLAQEMRAETPSKHTTAVLACVSNLLDFYMMMSLPDFNAEAAATACRNCVVLYEALSKEAHRAGEQTTWAMKPKIHMFQ